MGELQVTIRYNGFLVDHQVVRVRDVVRIGDSVDAKVSFPGASVAVHRVGDALDIRGRRLLEGERTGFSLGQVKVELEHLRPVRIPRPKNTPLDLRFLLLALGVTTAGMWVDRVQATLHSPPPGKVAAWVEDTTRILPLAREREHREQVAAVRPSAEENLLPTPVAAGEGRAATNDDRTTGIAYYRWYRSIVPSTLEAELARIRLAQDPGNSEHRARVARGAYDNDDFAQALAHYQILLESDPGNTRWLWGRSQAEKRLGFHTRELESYRQILETDPDNAGAWASGAVTLGRMGDFDAAEDWLSQALEHGEGAPYLHLYEGMLLALEGEDKAALAAIEDSVRQRDALSAGQRIELRRDLAIDPALSSLRGGAELRSLLWRHYGAAAPRKLRR